MRRGKTRTLDGMDAARLRPYAATAAIVAGALLLVVTANSTVNALRVVAHVYSSTPNIQDTYYVVPRIWVGLFVYGAGVLGGMAFRAMAGAAGRAARVLWRTHLVATTLLILVALALNAGAVIASDWQIALLVNGTYLLMLLAHSAALIVGGLLLVRGHQV